MEYSDLPRLVREKIEKWCNFHLEDERCAVDPGDIIKLYERSAHKYSDIREYLKGWSNTITFITAVWDELENEPVFSVKYWE